MEIEGPVRLDTTEQERTRAPENQTGRLQFLEDEQKAANAPTISTMQENLYHNGGVDARGTVDRER